MSKFSKLLAEFRRKREAQKGKFDPDPFFDSFPQLGTYFPKTSLKNKKKIKQAVMASLSADPRQLVYELKELYWLISDMKPFGFCEGAWRAEILEMQFRFVLNNPEFGYFMTLDVLDRALLLKYECEFRKLYRVALANAKSPAMYTWLTWFQKRDSKHLRYLIEKALEYATEPCFVGPLRMVLDRLQKDQKGNFWGKRWGFSDNHPSVKLIKAKIEALKAK